MRSAVRRRAKKICKRRRRISKTSTTGLATRRSCECGLVESSNGKIKYQSQSSQIVNVAVPLVMVMLIFIVTLIGTSPIAANVVEEKQLRIAEVLLGKRDAV